MRNYVFHCRIHLDAIQHRHALRAESMSHRIVKWRPQLLLYDGPSLAAIVILLFWRTSGKFKKHVCTRNEQVVHTRLVRPCARPSTASTVLRTPAGDVGAGKASPHGLADTGKYAELNFGAGCNQCPSTTRGEQLWGKKLPAGPCSRAQSFERPRQTQTGAERGGRGSSMC